MNRWFIEASFDGFIIEIKVAVYLYHISVRAAVNVLSGKSGFTLLDKPRVKEIGVHVT